MCSLLCGEVSRIMIYRASGPIVWAHVFFRCSRCFMICFLIFRFLCGFGVIMFIFGRVSRNEL